MNNKKILILGCGGHAKSVIPIIEENNELEIIGLIGQPEEIGKKVFNYDIIGSDNILKDLKNSCDNAFICIGQIKNSGIRKKAYNLLLKLGFNLPSIIAKSSYISKNTKIGNGTFIGINSIINSCSIIGENCIINTNSLIEHDSKIGSHSHISTGVIINGSCHIGEESFVGSGAIIRNNISIPPKTIISAGKRVMGWPLKEN